MSTLILDKTLSLLSEVISKLQLEAAENDYWEQAANNYWEEAANNYWESEYENSVEDHYSKYGF